MTKTPKLVKSAIYAPTDLQANGPSNSNTKERGEWTKGLQPTLEMWEYILDGLKRRYQRREGVDDRDIEQVEKIIQNLPKPREID